MIGDPSWRRTHYRALRVGRLPPMVPLCVQEVGPRLVGGPGSVALGRQGWRSRACGEDAVQLAGDVAFEAADDFGLGHSGGSAARDVGAGGWIPAHASQGEQVQGAIRIAVTAATEPMTVGLARG